MRLAGHGTVGEPWLAAAFVLAVASVALTRSQRAPERLARRRGRRPDGPARAAFEPRWVRWNAVRAVLAAGALVALAVGLSGS
jgi:uncharacterized membrane protein